jgi:hypothetical protein
MPATDIRARPEAVIRAREILVAFLVTFLCARILVYLIMARKIPDLYAHVGQTHVHHLNYGIFLLSFVGAFLLLAQPRGDWLTMASLMYGVGLALTFDEFGMWLHLGGSYWQRASFDAVVIIGALLGLIAAAPQLRRFRPQHWLTAGALLVLLCGFGFTVHLWFRHAEKEWGPRFEQLEAGQPM